MKFDVVLLLFRGAIFILPRFPNDFITCNYVPHGKTMIKSQFQQRASFANLNLIMKKDKDTVQRFWWHLLPKFFICNWLDYKITIQPLPRCCTWKPSRIRYIAPNSLRYFLYTRYKLKYLSLKIPTWRAIRQLEQFFRNKLAYFRNKKIEFLNTASYDTYQNGKPLYLLLIWRVMMDLKFFFLL